MRIAVVAVVFAGCKFAPPGATSVDAADPDGSTIVTKVCEVAAKVEPVAVNASLGDQPGGTNGIPQPDLECPAGQLPIGAGFETTTTPRPEGGPGDARVATAVTLQCGTVALLSDHTFAITPTTAVAFRGNACGGTWNPVTVAPVVQCPAGTILVGFDANGGPSSLFNTVSIACAPLTGSVAIGGVPQLVPVSDTGNYTDNHQVVRCTANEAVMSLALRANCGIDMLAPKCAALGCP